MNAKPAPDRPARATACSRVTMRLRSANAMKNKIVALVASSTNGATNTAVRAPVAWSPGPTIAIS